MSGLNRCFFYALVLLPCARADFDPSHWQFRRRIFVAGSPALARIRADSVLYRGSSDHLADVRIVQNGKEAPYLGDGLPVLGESREVSAAVLNKSVVPGLGLRLTLDAGNTVMHDEIDIVSPNRDYRQRVRIETSEDGRAWVLVRNDGYIGGVSGTDQPVSSSSVSYPVSTNRFLRVTILGWMDPKAVQSVRLGYIDRRPKVRAVHARFDHPAPAQNRAAKSTILNLDIGYEGLPYDALSLQIGPGWFYREVLLETSSDQKDWRYAGQGAVSRHMSGQEILTLSFPEQWSRYVRLTISNHDNQPLQILAVSLQSIVRVFRFAPAGAGEYWLYYGYPHATRPVYDLQYVAQVETPATGALATLGAQETNPAYRAPEPPRKPFSDRYPWLLYTVLGIAILGMGYVTLRFLKTINTRTAS